MRGSPQEGVLEGMLSQRAQAAGAECDHVGGFDKLLPTVLWASPSSQPATFTVRLRGREQPGSKRTQLL